MEHDKHLRTREFYLYKYYVNCGHTNEMKVWSSQLCLRFKQSQLSPKNVSHNMHNWYVRSSHNIHLSAVHIIFICFIPFTRTMNSTNWPAPNLRVFIAQLVEHCSANAEAMGSNPVEASKTFFGLNCDWLNRKHNCNAHTFISVLSIL